MGSEKSQGVSAACRRHNLRVLGLTVGASVAATLGVSNVSAAPADPAEESFKALEEIVVTARKREESMQGVPITVAAITGEVLGSTGVTSMSQIAQSVPSLTFTNFGGTPSVSMRGSANRLNGSPGVGFFTDGVYTVSSSQFSHGPLDVSRLEVLQGPQGTIYGRNTIAGAVNFVTNDPTDTLESSASAGYGGSSQSGDSLWHAQAIISGPLSDNLQARLAYRHNSREGYLRDPTSGGRLGYTEGDYARAKLKWMPTDSTVVRLTGEYAETRDPRFETLGYHPGGIYVHQGSVPLTPFFSGRSGDFYEIRVDPAHLPYSDSTLKRTYLQIEQETAIGTVSVDTSYSDYERETLADIDFIAERIAGQPVKSSGEAWTQEVRLTGSSERWKWLAGVFYMDDEVESDQRALFYPPGRLYQLGVAEQIQLSSQTTKSYAVFGQADYDITPKLSATVGARWSRDEKESPITARQTLASGAAAGAFSLNREDSWDSGTYLVSLRYNWTDDLMTYISQSTGFKAGGFQDSVNLAVASAAFDPEKVSQTEVGLKSELFDRRVRFNLSAYYLEYKDLQVQNVRIINGNIVTLIDNAAGSEVIGADLEIKAVLTNTLTLTVADTYLPTAKITGFSTIGGSPSIEGFRMQRSPKNAVSVGLDYLNEIGADLELQLGAAYTYRSDFVNEVDGSRKPDGSYATIPLPGYGLASVTASLTRGRWSVEGYVRNLTDKKYFMSGANLGGGALYPALVWGEPRTWELSLSYKFD